jgi:hypothetical protein
MGTPPDDSYLAASHHERIVGIPEHEFELRATHVIVVSATAINAPRCAGPRFRVEQIMLPSTIGYRFAIGLVVDKDREQHKIAKTFPLHGATLSEMSFALPLGIYVKEHLEIYVRRYTIKPWYRFLGETPRKDREQLSINTTRPEVKEPPTVNFVGNIRLLFAPPGGWN